MPSNMPPGAPVVAAMKHVWLVALGAGFLCTLAVLMVLKNVFPGSGTGVL